MQVLQRSLFNRLNGVVKLFFGLKLGKRFPLLKVVYFQLYEWLLPQRNNILGQQLRFHPKDRVLTTDALSKDGFERYELELFQALLQPGDVVLDIGANIGYYTTVAAAQVGAQGHVYAFEPDRENLAVLTDNLHFNDHSNVTIVPSGVAAQKGQVQLYLCEDNRGDHRLYPVAEESRASYVVETIALDTFWAGVPPRSPLPRPTMVKMDIQGFEYFALQGMQQYIQQTPDLILFTEFWPHALAEAGVRSPRVYFQALKDLDLELFLILENQQIVKPVTDLGEILATIEQADEYANLIAAKGQGYAAVAALVLPGVNELAR
jgi:FkbM family methyltransferase